MFTFDELASLAETVKYYIKQREGTPGWLEGEGEAEYQAVLKALLAKVDALQTPSAAKEVLGVLEGLKLSNHRLAQECRRRGYVMLHADVTVGEIIDRMGD